MTSTYPIQPLHPYPSTITTTTGKALEPSDTMNTVLAGISALVGTLALFTAILQLRRYRRQPAQRRIYHHLNVFELEAQIPEILGRGVRGRVQ
ncbi:hypothetical protein M3J09_001120 [Ascochyta lentis]